MDNEKALKGLSNFVESMASGKMRVNREKAMNTKINGFIIDTVMPGDTGKWETGIKKNGGWIIVEQYKNIKEATKGHTKWVKKIEEDLNCELKSIDLWGLEENLESL